ncbi:unnamed protein product [Linum trigynum]|uniref:NB-ARC domain-containing protein n=1 Tax=Linum trigynum TaxID=586398 RepID=A0AAV2DHB4_9ROSI
MDILLSTNHAEKVAVVPIIGIGGLGKTALAQLIYNDLGESSGFQIKIWVCVSNNFDEKLLVKKMLECVTKEEVKDLELGTLKHKLKEEMESKRFLLVLDDVWDDDVDLRNWDRLRDFLLGVATVGSRVIITTRIGEVAERMASSGIKPQELQGLPEKESWDLFEMIAFHGEEGRGEVHVKVAKEIVNKCVGVPLVIRAMAGTLASKKHVDDWVTIRDKQVMIGMHDKQQGILATLRLSYDNLPSHLRHCFAYCSLFPKDYNIVPETVVQLWVAQGYVDDESGEYFRSLLSRSFFQEGENDTSGNVSYRMHDLMHDLAVIVAGEESFTLDVLNLTAAIIRLDKAKVDKLRHLSFDFAGKSERKNLAIPTCLLKEATRLRTFWLTNIPDGGFSLGESEWQQRLIFSYMTRLRALSLRSGRMKSIPTCIYKLRHLRYLDLSDNDMETLPDEITRLVNLQVLLLEFCSYLRELPSDITKLPDLSVLGLDGCTSLTHIPVGIHRLCRLHRLNLFVVAVEGNRAARISELNRLGNLGGNLLIRGLELLEDKCEAEEANLEEKNMIRSLVLEWDSRTSSNGAADEMVLEALRPNANLEQLWLGGYSGTKLPSWLSSLTSVVSIQLGRCGKLRILPAFDPFVSLADLRLVNLPNLQYILVGTPLTLSSSSSAAAAAAFLPSLQSLEIRGCPNLERWATEETEYVPKSIFPSLSKLVIEHCMKLVHIPPLSAHVEHVELGKVTSELVVKLATALPPPPLTEAELTTTAAHSVLKSLRLQGISGTELLPQQLLPHLTSLHTLSIANCQDFITLSPAMPYLISLQKLSILDCCAFGSFDRGDGVSGESAVLPACGFPSLHYFYISWLPKLGSLPEWLQHSPNLKELKIVKCDGITCLPHWLAKLTALESLELNLCFELSQRCRSSEAEDWPNVAHIKNLKLSDHEPSSLGGRTRPSLCDQIQQCVYLPIMLCVLACAVRALQHRARN